MTARILSQHFARLRAQLLEFAAHTDLAKHGDVKGLAREAFVRTVLARNLPSAVEFKTGELLDCDDQRSGQIDVVLQTVDAPRIHLMDDVQLTFVDAVIGIIEVKSTLTTASWTTDSHLRAALDAFRRVKGLQRERVISGGNSVHTPLTRTPCFLFAYHGPTRETLVSALASYGQHHGIAPDEYLPDCAVVLDRGYYTCRDNGWVFPPAGGVVRHWEGDPDECLVGLHTHLSKLISAAYDNAHYVNVSNYFRKLEG